MPVPAQQKPKDDITAEAAGRRFSQDARPAPCGRSCSASSGTCTPLSRRSELNRGRNGFSGDRDPDRSRPDVAATSGREFITVFRHPRAYRLVVRPDQPPQGPTGATRNRTVILCRALFHRLGAPPNCPAGRQTSPRLDKTGNPDPWSAAGVSRPSTGQADRGARSSMSGRTQSERALRFAG